MLLFKNNIIILNVNIFKYKKKSKKKLINFKK